MWKNRLVVVGQLRVGRIRHMVCPGAITRVAPDVVQIQPMSHFMNRRAAQVERRSRRPVSSKRGVENDDTVSRGRAARKLCVTEQTSAERTGPEIEIFRRRPGGRAAGGCVLHVIIRAEG